jgi:hypothetical protein
MFEPTMVSSQKTRLQSKCYGYCLGRVVLTQPKADVTEFAARWSAVQDKTSAYGFAACTLLQKEMVEIYSSLHSYINMVLFRVWIAPLPL